jgi:hypothetical protein
MTTYKVGKFKLPKDGKQLPIISLPAERTIFRAVRANRPDAENLTLYESKSARFKSAGVFLGSDYLTIAEEARLLKRDGRGIRVLSVDQLKLYLLFKAQTIRNLKLIDISAAINQGRIPAIVTASHLTDPAGFFDLGAVYEEAHRIERYLLRILPDSDGFTWQSRFGGGHNFFLRCDLTGSIKYPPPKPLMRDRRFAKLIADAQNGHLELP